MKDTLQEAIDLLQERLRVVPVPVFNTSQEATEFFNNLKPNQTPDSDIVDPETGEVLLDKGARPPRVSPDDDHRRWLKGQAKDRQEAEDDWIFDPMYHIQDDFEDRFTVLWKSVRDIVGDESAEELRDADYDPDLMIPHKIRHKYHPTLTEYDVESIDNFVKYLNIPPSMQGVDYIENQYATSYAQVGDTYATVEPVFN